MTTKDELIIMLSPIYERSRIMQAILQAVATELTTGELRIEDYGKQLFPQTATWGLTFWEAEYGIEPRAGASIEERRAAVLFEMNDREPLTPNALVRKVERLTGATAQIVAHLSPYTLKINARRPERIKETLIRELREIIPAHLDFYIDIIHEAEGEFYFAAASRDLKIIRYREYMPTEIKAAFKPYFAGAITKVLITTQKPINDNYRTADGLPIFIQNYEMRIVDGS